MTEFLCEWDECGEIFHSQTTFERHLKKHIIAHVRQSKREQIAMPTKDYFQCKIASEDDDSFPRPEVLLSPLSNQSNNNSNTNFTVLMEKLTKEADPSGETVVVFCSLCESFYKKFSRSPQDPWRLNMKWVCQFCRPRQ